MHSKLSFLINHVPLQKHAGVHHMKTEKNKFLRACSMSAMNLMPCPCAPVIL